MFYFWLSMTMEHVPVLGANSNAATDKARSAGTNDVRRAVIVTGGTRGIGRVIAERFLAAGCDVVVCARKPPEREIVVDGRVAYFVAADIREPAEIERVTAEAKAKLGRLDVLVNNAGGSPPADAATASPRFSAAIINLNLTAPLLFAQRANAIMQGQPEGGVIVNVASVSGLRPSPGTAAYGAAKAGLISLTRSLAVEWAPKVRVVAVAPGPIRTELAELHYGDAAAQARVAATVPLGRLGEPSDVAEACFMLASPACGWIAGACLVLDGGGERPAFLGASKVE
jgi:NAD(P)-dependent dehydrogenase (short-subunit alcohol dehydrogenase family)